jgi:hypothetical protein
MVLPVVGKFCLGSFGFGAAAATFGAALARPVLVGTVRAGYQTTDFVAGAWQAAKAEAESIKSEALTRQASSGTDAEVQQLRAEVASLRAQLGKKAS